ncbi:MAG: tRNA (5-methylaminomethyl-2-thiouridine)(34)-methyltransferase MnmD [Balneolaceae bacterium]|nr:tRNA (5-methylaminomethyl-2-thiouridine)(34)-methyltransferase MnmD [Balneolaceae bacterium]MCH8550152.1 tRNA (5-methylaminomethyl-2-thiouridine)(34)-methyltransferase MnmD [Balneolaceae bacterium]
MKKSKSDAEIRATKDGSTTLFSDQFSQHYHNPNGAVAESRHVFFDSLSIPERLERGEPIQVFEMGFGTGLNLVLLKDYMERSGNRSEVTFNSVEAYPVESDLVKGFDFGEELNAGNPQKWLETIFSELKKGLNRFEISEQLTLSLYIGTFDEMPSPPQPVTDIFHDPFSPEVNAELWTPAVFHRIKTFCRDDAMLATYCAASKARAAMAVGGWHTARKRGALGKREMTVASLNPERLSGLKRLNDDRLRERFERGDFE